MDDPSIEALTAAREIIKLVADLAISAGEGGSFNLDDAVIARIIDKAVSTLLP